MTIVKILPIIGIIGMVFSLFLFERSPEIDYLFDPLMFVFLGIDSIVNNFEEITKTNKYKYLMFIYMASIIVLPLMFGLKSMGIIGTYTDTFASLYKIGVLGIAFYFSFTFKNKNNEKQNTDK